MSKKIDDTKIMKTLQSCQKVLNENQLSASELILFYGNLGYHLGAAIAGITAEQGPDIETLQKRYYKTPTVDIGLMLQGLLITSWEEDFKANPLISDIKEDYNKKEEEEKEND